MVGMHAHVVLRYGTLHHAHRHPKLLARASATQRTSNKVLARWHVDGRLAAYAGVDHCCCGRWHLDVWHTTHVRRCDEANQITDHTTSECNHAGIAIAAMCQLCQGITSRILSALRSGGERIPQLGAHHEVFDRSLHVAAFASFASRYRI